MTNPDLTGKSEADKRQLAEYLLARKEKIKWEKLRHIFPDKGPFGRDKYPIQMLFMEKGKDHRFRALMGGNRSGKSFCVATELCYHVTGEYPSWWKGKIQRKPETWWVVCESGKLWRDSLQILLFGQPGEEIGTGLLPLAEKNNGVGIIEWTGLEGTGGAIGRAIIKHRKGHNVTLIVKTYEMRREQFQAARVSGILFDEEPPLELYNEALMRLMGTGTEPGIAMIAFTPLKGLSDVILKFLPKGAFPYGGTNPDTPENFVCQLEWSNAPHLSHDEKETMMRNMSPQEKESRTKGIPSLGSGRIYPIEEEFIKVKAFQIPDHWPRLYGLDFGWQATAAVWIAKDPLTKIHYIYSEYKRGQQAPYVHANAIKAKGEWMNGLADPSGANANVRDGLAIINDYIALGLHLFEGRNDIVAGINKILNMFESGTLKIFNTCSQILDELRVYRYSLHNPNKPADDQEDHLLDAMKYGITQFDIYAKSPAEMEDENEENNYINLHGRSNLTGY